MLINLIWYWTIHDKGRKFLQTETILLRCFFFKRTFLSLSFSPFFFFISCFNYQTYLLHCCQTCQYVIGFTLSLSLWWFPISSYPCLLYPKTSSLYVFISPSSLISSYSSSLSTTSSSFPSLSCCSSSLSSVDVWLIILLARITNVALFILTQLWPRAGGMFSGRFRPLLGNLFFLYRTKNTI